MRWNPQADYGSEIPEPRSFEDLGGWFKYMRTEGFNVPVQVPTAIQRAQRAMDLDAQGAFDWLKENKLLVIYPGGATIDIRATVEDLDELVAREDTSDMDS